MPYRVSRSVMTYLLLAMTLATLLAGCGPTVTPQMSRHLPKPVADHSMTLLWGDDVKKQALTAIDHSRHRCYLDIYELSDKDILRALAATKQRGVDVRVIVDATEPHSQSVAVPYLKSHALPMESLHIKRGISHIKMLITDEDVLIGGMNYGANSWANNDASVYLPHANKSFIALFRWDWSRAEGTPSTPPYYRLPLLDDRTTEREVIRAIRSAKKSVYLEAFNLSDWGVMDALSVVAKRNVLVEVLLDGGQAQNRKSAQELRDMGATVRFYHPYGNEWMHAKILDVDDGKTFIIGSANFSHQAYTYNHEGDIELHNVSNFHHSLNENLSIQISRGTDYPVKPNKVRW